MNEQKDEILEAMQDGYMHQAMQEALRTIPQIAQMTAAYRQALIDSGLSEENAMMLTVAMQRAMLGK